MKTYTLCAIQFSGKSQTFRHNAEIANEQPELLRLLHYR
jgi:hypothetical protein